MNYYRGTNAGITESITPEDRDVWDVMLSSKDEEEESILDIFNDNKRPV